MATCLHQLAYLLCIVIFCQGKEHNIEYLKNIFTPDAENLVHVEYKDVENIPVNVKTLSLSISSEEHQQLNLNFLKNFKQIKELRILDSHGSKCSRYRGAIGITINKTIVLDVPITRIHIGLRLLDTDSLGHFLEKINNLEIIDLSGSYMFGNNASFALFGEHSGVEFKRVKALNLKETLAKQGLTLDLQKVLRAITNSPVQYLDLSYNKLIAISGSTTGLLPHLRILDLSHNPLQYHTFSLFLFELFVFHPEIEVIDLNHGIEDDPICGAEVHGAASNLTTLIRDCQHQFNASLNTLIENKTHYCDIFLCGIKQAYTTPIGSYDIPCTYIPSFKRLPSFTRDTCQFVPMSTHLREVTIGSLAFLCSQLGFNLDSSMCFEINNVRRISVTGSSFYTWKSQLNIIGLENVTSLNLSGLQLSIDLQSPVMRSFRKLHQLDLSYNSVNTSVPLFISSIANSLKLLNLSYSNISDSILSPSYLRNISNLEYISLAGNLLEKFDLNFSDGVHLRKVNLRNNNITMFSSLTLESLKTAGCMRNSVLEIDLRGNMLLCTCADESIETVAFIQSAQTYRVRFVGSGQYQCALSDDSIKGTLLSYINISLLRSTCNPSYKMIVTELACVSVTIVVTLMVIVSGYRFRYLIKLYWLRLCWYRKRGDQSVQVFNYDAFISYCADDRFWVHDTLLKELEDVYGFRLCIHYRDFKPGEDIIEAILRATSESRSIICIISESSHSSEWCDFELKVAYGQSIRNRKNLIIIKLGDIKLQSETSPLIREILDSRTYFEWPMEMFGTEINKRKRSGGKDRHDLFWARLTTSLLCKPPTANKRLNSNNDENDELQLMSNYAFDEI